jgi:hypothetical protein
MEDLVLSLAAMGIEIAVDLEAPAETARWLRAGLGPAVGDSDVSRDPLEIAAAAGLTSPVQASCPCGRFWLCT